MNTFFQLLFMVMALPATYGAGDRLVNQSVTPGRKVAAARQIWPHQDYGDYEWVNSKTVFVCSSGEGLKEPALYHLVTGKRTRLRSLEAMTLERSIHGEPECTENYELSPNGQYMLWNRSDGNVHTAKLNGMAHRVWRLPDNENLEFSPIARWLSDGNRWVEDDVNTISRVFKDNPRAAYVGDLTSSSTRARRYSERLSPYLIYAKSVLSQNHQYNGCILLPVKVSGKTKLKIAYPEPPIPVAPTDLAGSRDRKWLAWLLVHRTYGQAGEQKVPDITGEIWITSLNGKVRHLLLQLPLKPANEGKDAPDLVRWLPNNKEISYIWNGALYCVRLPDL